MLVIPSMRRFGHKTPQRRVETIQFLTFISFHQDRSPFTCRGIVMGIGVRGIKPCVFEANTCWVSTPRNPRVVIRGPATQGLPVGQDIAPCW